MEKKTIEVVVEQRQAMVVGLWWTLFLGGYIQDRGMHVIDKGIIFHIDLKQQCWVKVRVNSLMMVKVVSWWWLEKRSWLLQWH
jgi:hypothetical protein